jgi:hypothetical protein
MRTFSDSHFKNYQQILNSLLSIDRTPLTMYPIYSRKSHTSFLLTSPGIVIQIIFLLSPIASSISGLRVWQYSSVLVDTLSLVYWITSSSFSRASLAVIIYNPSFTFRFLLLYQKIISKSNGGRVGGRD